MRCRSAVEWSPMAKGGSWVKSARSLALGSGGDGPPRANPQPPQPLSKISNMLPTYLGRYAAGVLFAVSTPCKAITRSRLAPAGHCWAVCRIHPKYSVSFLYNWRVLSCDKGCHNSERSDVDEEQPVSRVCFISKSD